VSPRFDSDTALEPIGAGRWRATVREHWFVANGPNGGFLAALAARAMAETAGSERSPRSLTLHYLRPPAAGELEIAVTVDREGSSTTFMTLRIEQGGELVAHALACSAAWREGQPEWAHPGPPVLPRAEDCEPLPLVEGTPRFFTNYELRPAIGMSVPDPPQPATVGGWMRTAEPHPADSALLAALTDAWVPAAFVRMPVQSFVPTIDLTVHWRAPADAAPGGHPFVLGLFTTRLAAGGVWEEDGELWSEDGVLLAQSRQLAIVRRPRG